MRSKKERSGVRGLFVLALGVATAVSGGLVACSGDNSDSSVAGGGASGGGSAGASLMATPQAPLDVDHPAVSELRGSTRQVAVELTEGTNMAATPSPDGSKIAFSAQGALWVIPSAGGKATRITNVDVEPTAPVWSPDGSMIAFQTYTTGGNYHIWTIAPDGSNPVELTSGYFDDREPAWTADGSALVFSSDRSNDGQYKIWSYQLGAGTYTQLTKGPGAESNPVVSPDGSQIAFVDTNRVFTALFSGVSAPILIGPGLAPQWKPDGSGLVYQPTSRSLNANGKDIVPDEDLFPFPVRFLPDGRFLYTADGKLKIRALDGGSLQEVPFSATLDVRRPLFSKKKDHGFDQAAPRLAKGISAPVISPDATQVAFVALNDVWVMKIGDKPVRLTDDADRDGNVQWTPDGRAVYFSSEKGNGGALAIDQVEVETKVRKRLAAIPAKSMVSPKMSPTGDRIAYTTLSGQLEIWDIGGQVAQLVAPQVSTQLSTPQWTPDASKIMLVDNERINNRFREGYNKLRVIDIGSKTAVFYPVAEAPRQVSDREEGAAVLSPDGTQVALIMDSVLHVLPVGRDGAPAGEAIAITTEVADLPSWAGDSRTILYKSADRLRLIQADGSGVKDVPLELPWAPKIPEGVTIVHAGAVWDGISPTVQQNMEIVVRRNRITEIRPGQGGRKQNVERDANGVRHVDATGLTVIPGLWDPHIHPLTLYQGGQYGQIAALMLSYGITSTQSVAGPLHQSIEIREALEAGTLVGPRLFVSPPLWEGNRQFYSFARTLRTPAIAELEITKALKLGVDYMKSYVRAPMPIMALIAQAGLDHGIPTGTHMLSPGSAMGLAGTTHLSATQRMGYGWSKSTNGITYQDAYDLHAKSDFHNVDTLFSSTALVGQDPAFLSDDRFRWLVPPNFIAGLQGTAAPNEATLATIRRDAEQSAKVQRAGGLLALGTDSPLVTPGIALHTGIRAGAMVYSNMQALQNVTINAAKMSFVDRDLGTLEVGKLADMAMVRGNPLEDLKAAADVRMVMKNGIPMTLDEILAPFRTPTAVAEREKALAAFRTMCATLSPDCYSFEHDHAY
jgi:Tol biopolymer transport system component/imidazolonepropionase-like amidohydrolase